MLNKLQKVGGVNNPGYSLSPFSTHFPLELDNLFDRLYDSFWESPQFLRDRNWRYSEYSEDENNYYISIEVPGFSKNQIKLSTKGNSLLVTAKNDRSNYSRTFTNDWDLSKLTNQLENGVLKVTIPKSENAKEKEIEIKEVK